MLLTQDGLRALGDFIVHAAPEYDEHFNHVDGNDGVMLVCKQQHGDGGGNWQKHWPGHVAAPTIRDLAMVTQQHWDDAHRQLTADDAAEEATA